MPSVTVFIPTYNRAHFLPAAIDSILQQTFTDFELLIVDDGSSDETAGLLEDYRARDRRIRIESNATNLGSPKTRNRGLDLAQGNFIAMLDSDDIAAPDRLERQVEFLTTHEDHALVGSNKTTFGSVASLGRFLRRRPTAPEAIRARLLFRCCIAHSTVMGRTDILRTFRYDETFDVSQDFDLFVRLSESHKIANIADPLVRVRRHAGQVSRKRADVKSRLRLILRRQLEALDMTYSEDDLERHLMLARPRSWHAPTRDDLVWSETWLQRLTMANRRTARYDKAVFEQVVGEAWFELCLKAMPGLAKAPYRWLWRSPLASSAWAGVRRRILNQHELAAGP
ncbi:MAG: glycosyltransferase family A protein [Pseudomonadota bacterium]